MVDDLPAKEARARSDFLAVMSHEIRTSLAGMLGAAALLEEMQLPAPQHDHVRVIVESGAHLLQLVNDVRDYSQLESAATRLELAAFDPRALVSGAAELFRAQATRKELRLSVVVSPDVPPSVIGDAGRLRQVLLTLIGKAVTFTEQGWVQVCLSAEPIDAARALLRFSVADSGNGIPPEAIARMFETAGEHADPAARHAGSVLGLAICRRLVDLMGGRIRVDTRPGEGSLFRFGLTLPRDAPLPMPAVTGVAGGLRILLAEDNAINQIVALRLLQRLGHVPDAVPNGAAAISALALKPYDLVLMDMIMPELDGLAATRAIRANEAPGTHLPVIGLTAASLPEDLAACIEAGMDGVATKPVTLATLRAAIAEGMAHAARHAAPAQTIAARLAELREDCGDALPGIIEAFIEEMADLRQTMAAAREAGETAALRRHAHSLAGAARNLGADALGDCAAALAAVPDQPGFDALDREIASAVAVLGRGRGRGLTDPLCRRSS